MLTNLVDQQTTFFITHVSRRRTIEQSHRVLLFVLRHVETKHGRLVIEEEVGQRFCQLGLTCSSRTKEEERTHGLSFLVQARAAFEDGVEDALDGMILTHHTLVQYLFGVAQFLALLALDVTHRNASHLGHHIAHGVLLQLHLLLLVLLVLVKSSHLSGYLNRRHSAIEQIESR